MNCKNSKTKFIRFVNGKRIEPDEGVSGKSRTMFLQVDDNRLYVILDNHMSIPALLFMVMFSDVFILVIMVSRSIILSTSTADGFLMAIVAIDIFWVIIWIIKTRDVYEYIFDKKHCSVIKNIIKANLACDAIDREILVAGTRETREKTLPFIIDKIVCFEGNNATTVDSLYFLNLNGNKLDFCRGYLKAKILEFAHFLSINLGIPILYEVVGHGFTTGWRKYEHGLFVGYLTT